MITTEITYKGECYTCRIVKSNDGEELIVAGISLLDELMPYEITDECNGFADKEAEEVDEEIFYYTSDSDLRIAIRNLSQFSKRVIPNGLIDDSLFPFIASTLNGRGDFASYLAKPPLWKICPVILDACYHLPLK